VTDAMAAGIPPGAAEAAPDTLGGAVAVDRQARPGPPHMTFCSQCVVVGTAKTPRRVGDDRREGNPRDLVDRFACRRRSRRRRRPGDYTNAVRIAQAAVRTGISPHPRPRGRPYASSPSSVTLSRSAS
jgi:hypothetical protein